MLPVFNSGMLTDGEEALLSAPDVRRFLLCRKYRQKFAEQDGITRKSASGFTIAEGDFLFTGQVRSSNKKYFIWIVKSIVFFIAEGSALNFGGGEYRSE